MCGRFALSVDPDALMRFIELLAPPVFEPRYNIAPTQPILVAFQEPGGRSVRALRWGLIPPFMRDKKPGRPLINARAETLFDKPSFRRPAKRHRCVVPASGFYEWEKADKQPWLFRPAQGELLAFAAIWQPGDSSREVPDSVAIVTTSANTTLRPVHHRMPVILDERGVAGWLDPEQSERSALEPLLIPAADHLLEAMALDGYVSNMRNQGPRCWTPVESSRQGSLF